MSSTDTEQRQSDAISSALGTPAHNVLSMDEAASQIGIVMADQAQADHAQAAPEPPPVDDEPVPQWEPHPARGQVLAAVQQAEELARQSAILREEAQRLRASGQAHLAGELLAQALERQQQSVQVAAQAQVAAQQVAAAEQGLASHVTQKWLKAEDRKIARELGDNWNEGTKAHLREFALAHGITPQELARVDSRSVLLLAKAAGIGGDRRSSVPDGVKARLRPGSASNAVERAFVNRHVRPGSLEAAAVQLSSGVRVDPGKQQALWNRGVTQPAARPGRPSSQQSEAAIAARLARVMGR